jgi:hypothetical protein
VRPNELQRSRQAILSNRTLRIPIVQTEHLPADLPRIDLASDSLDDSGKLVSRNRAGSFGAVFGVRRWIPV